MLVGRLTVYGQATLKMECFAMPDNMSTPPEETRKLFEPTLYFSSLSMRIGENASANRVTVSELVRKGDLLLRFENPAHFQEGGFEKQPVKAGEYTFFSEDQSELYAEVAGYPRLDRYLSDMSPIEGLTASIEPLFTITPDHMKATLAVHPPLPGGRSLADQDLDQLIAEAGLVFGLDSERIAAAKAYIRQGLREFKAIPIATGRECGPSQDAYLKFELEIGPIAGRLLRDGTIDFRERRVMVPVIAGQLLARKMPALAGTAGVDVFGRKIEARPGKDIEVRTSGEVTYSPDTMNIRATGAGALSVVRDNVIKVSSRQQIDGDIDFSTGNVESGNCLIIRGSVVSGFSVKAEGDIEIDGTVRSAMIEGQANVVIKGCITGQRTKIFAEGDADIIIVEQGEIVCGGNCVVRKLGYYSSIHANGDIRCKNDSVVMGGELVAAGSISLGDVGADKATPCLLAAGVAPERLKSYRRIKQNLIELQQEIIQLMQMQGRRSRRQRHLEKDAVDLKQRLHRLNMIPGTGLYSRAGKGDDPHFSDAEYSIEDSIDIKKITIEVFGNIQAGTTIQIGNRILVLETNMSGRLFRLNDTMQRILEVPLGRASRAS